MIVAIPSVDDKGLDSELDEHFGHSPYFTIIDVDKQPPMDGRIKKNLFIDEECKVSSLSNHNEGECVCDAPIDKILQQKVQYLLVSGIGGGPFTWFTSRGIDIYAGAVGTIREVLRDFLCGMLTKLQQASCGHTHGPGGHCSH